MALLRAPAVLAQSTPTTTTTTTSSAAPSCTASLITSLCDYKDPGPDFAVAIDSRASCWEWCDAHPPCNFVIFNAGNPNTGSGTCWLYPGQTFDASAGKTCGRPNLSVYDKPTCSGGSPTTTTSGACAATATPSAVASICGYEPPSTCFETCSASLGAVDCLSQCANAEACSYVVFNPHNPDNSPYADGTCWMYTNGTYNAGAATTCSGAPEQYVYNNVCPKPAPSSPSGTASASASTASTASTGTATSSTGVAKALTDAKSRSKTNSGNLASHGLSLTFLMAIGINGFMW